MSNGSIYFLPGLYCYDLTLNICLNECEMIMPCVCWEGIIFKANEDVLAIFMQLNIAAGFAGVVVEQSIEPSR